MGYKFDVSCASSICTLTSEDPTVTPDSCGVGDGTDTFVLTWGKILVITALPVMSAGDVELSAADPSHPVACASNADCLSPGLTSVIDSNGDTQPFSCQSGICQLPSQPLLTVDVIALCQADIRWPESDSCPYVVSQPFASRMVEVAAGCGPNSKCSTVPADCRQLTAGTDGGILVADGGITAADGGAPMADSGASAVDGGTVAADGGI
jgi:hypothetical protein